MDTTPAPPPHVRPLRAQLFGAVRLGLDERDPPHASWLRQRQRPLCLLLLATPGHTLSRERIMDLLWPGADPAAASNALAKALHALRRALEPDLTSGTASAYLVSAAGRIGFRPGTVVVDVDEFAALLAEAARLPPAQRRPLLRQSLALYGGDLLADELSADWPVGRRESLRRERRRAAFELADLALVAGEPGEALAPLETLTAADPADEDAQLRLMRCFAACGQPERALRQYRRCQDALQRELDVAPGSALADYAATLQAARLAAPATARTPLRLAPLPQPPTPLLGRDREVDALHDCLAGSRCRLVTLTGPAGVGKTRLAQEVAATTDSFPDGVIYLPLADIRAPELLVLTIARAIGTTDRAARDHLAAIQQAIGDRRILLVLDNCEQLLAAAGDLSALLASCPGLTLLVTSRIPFHLPDEVVVVVEPLPQPPVSDRLTPRALLRYPAAALFLDRLVAVRPDFEPTDAAAPQIGAICRRLEGLPLALELAAARGRHLTLGELLSRLGHRLDVLTGGPRDLPERQRTLRATLAWSYDALTPAEQTLFRRLAVFAGGCTTEGAAWLGRYDMPPIPPPPLSPDSGRKGGFSYPPPNSGDAPPPGWGRSGGGSRREAPGRGLLDALVEANLLRVAEASKEPRYSMLETMREYGLERLAASGEEATARAAHAAYVLELAERLHVHQSGADQPDALDRMALEEDNLRGALAWFLDQEDGGAALRLCLAAKYYWDLRGYLVEGMAWLDRVLMLTVGQVTELRAKALYAFGTLAEKRGDLDQAEARLEEAVEIWRALGDHPGVGMALNFLGHIAVSRGDIPQARSLQEAALTTMRAAGGRLDVAMALVGLGNAEIYLHEFAAAEAHYEEAMALFRELDDAARLSTALANFGVLEFWQGKLERAAACYEESLTLSRGLGYRRGIADILVNQGELQAVRGDLDQAARSCQEGLQIYQELGDQRSAALTRTVLANIALDQDDDDLAGRHLRAAVAAFDQLGDQASLVKCLEMAARIPPLCPTASDSARLLGATAALREQIGVPRELPDEAAYERCLTALKDQLTPDAFDVAWQAGRSMTLAEAVAELLPAAEPALNLAG